MSTNKDYFAVIMAGGVGSRFWPVSTADYPKQFHDMLGTGQSLIQKTFDRLSKLVPQENILILTNAGYKGLVQEQLPSVTDAQLVLEPMMRNTAPCILLAALKIQKINPNGVMLVAPSDHWIEDETAFCDNIQTAFDACATGDMLMTLGIKPSFPNTGYGYIQFAKNQNTEINKVVRFTEKPDYETAKSFLASGDFVWNSGIFIWSITAILKAFKNDLSEMYALFMQGMDVYNTSAEQQFVNTRFGEADNISIDYGIMEKANNVYMLSADFDWNDLGAWGALYDKLDKTEDDNAIVGAKTLLNDASGNMIYSNTGRIIVAEGIKDFIIVDKKGVLLLVPKEKEQEIKRILNQVKDRFGSEFT
ncbi:MAG: mannose-1-phosphate guanylyltransferase [Gilvibacter sp.]